MKSILYLLVFSTSALLMVSCKSHKKTLLVYANSKIAGDQDQKNFTVKTGTTHVEQEFVYSTGDPVEITTNGPLGTKKFEIKEDGKFLLNLTKDTAVGAMQHVGENAATEVTQVQLKAHIDSLSKLILNQNVTAKGKNFFVAPGMLVKVSEFPEAKIWGPFTTIPGAFDASSVPEVYKFYNVPDERVIIGKLTQMSKYQGAEEEERAEKEKEKSK